MGPEMEAPRPHHDHTKMPKHTPHHPLSTRAGPACCLATLFPVRRPPPPPPQNPKFHTRSPPASNAPTHTHPTDSNPHSLNPMAPAANDMASGRAQQQLDHQPQEHEDAEQEYLIQDGITRTLCLVEPKPQDRRPEDKIPTLITLTKRVTVIGRSLKVRL